MATTGQTINDRLNAVRYALVGQGLARTVCKATTEEVLGPKKKHIDYLLACTDEPNVSIPQLANLLFERSQHTSWAVVFKALITMHQLMSNGNERFTQYLATSNHTFNLSDFMDRSSPQGYGMSPFVRSYAKYVNEKMLSYRALAIDLCKIRRGADNALRTMNMENLGKTLPIVQKQFDALLEFGADQKDLNNGIILAAFKMLYKDLVKIYVAYQEAIINLLERYFKLSRKKARDALEMYKTHLACMEKVTDFLRIVCAVNLDKSEMPDLTSSATTILPLLESHLAQLEAKKRGGTASPDPEATTQAGEDGQTQPTAQPTAQPSSTSQVSTTIADDESHPAPESQQQRPPNDDNDDTKVPTPKQPPKPTGSPSRPPPPPAPPKQPSPEEKKGPPPSRPAPPSRPPPPSAITTAAASSPSSEPTHQQPPPPHPRPPAAAVQHPVVSPPQPPPHPLQQAQQSVQTEHHDNRVPPPAKGEGSSQGANETATQDDTTARAQKNDAPTSSAAPTVAENNEDDDSNIGSANQPNSSSCGQQAEVVIVADALAQVSIDDAQAVVQQGEEVRDESANHNYEEGAHAVDGGANGFEQQRQYQVAQDQVQAQEPRQQEAGEEEEALPPPPPLIPEQNRENDQNNLQQQEEQVNGYAENRN